MHENPPDQEKLFKALNDWRALMDLAEKGDLIVDKVGASNYIRELLGDSLGILHTALPTIPGDETERMLLGKVYIAELGTFVSTFSEGTADVRRGFCTIPGRYLLERPFNKHGIGGDHVYRSTLKHSVAVTVRDALDWEPASKHTNDPYLVQVRSDVREVVNARMFRIPKN